MRKQRAVDNLKYDSTAFENQQASYASCKANNNAEEIMLARWNHGDYRKAEAIILAHTKIDPFQKLKTLLSRGHFEEAKDLLINFKKNSEYNQQIFCEILLDQARLEAFEANWNEALMLCNQALETEMPAITKQTIFQVRSIANYELGYFQNALTDIEKVLSLVKLFPQSSVAKYAKATKAKILLLQGNKKEAINIQQELWSTLKDNPQHTNLRDHTLSLLRLEIDLRRIQQQPTFELSCICHQIAEEMGDALYSDLAKLDMWAVNKESCYSSVYSRCNKIYLEAVSQKTDSTTAQIIRNYTAPANILDLEKKEEVHSNYILPDQSLLIKTGPLRIQEVKSEQISRALVVLSKPISHEEFFCKIWGMKYNPTLHLNNLQVLLHRVRKEYGLDIISKNKIIFAEQLQAVVL